MAPGSGALTHGAESAGPADLGVRNRWKELRYRFEWFAATGRDGIVKFADAYHGHVDGLLGKGGSGLATQGLPASPGVTRAQAADTMVDCSEAADSRRIRCTHSHPPRNATLPAATNPCNESTTPRPGGFHFPPPAGEIHFGG